MQLTQKTQKIAHEYLNVIGKIIFSHIHLRVSCIQ